MYNNLFNLFSNKVEKVSPKVTKIQKSGKELIDEIHHSFYNEVNQLLADAKIMKSNETKMGELLDKAARLKKLGFTNTKEVIEANVEIERLKRLNDENQSKIALQQAINYFSYKYPNYKFITEQSVKRICNKYGLVYATIDNYIGTVPDKNLKHIEDFKIDDKDCQYGYFINGRFRDNLSIYDYYRGYESNLLNQRKKPLEIVAPINNFNRENLKLEDFKLIMDIKDPIVLHPVLFENAKYYLIVTAWGDEASDELVVNEKLN